MRVLLLVALFVAANCLLCWAWTRRDFRLFCEIAPTAAERLDLLRLLGDDLSTPRIVTGTVTFHDTLIVRFPKEAADAE